MCLRTSASHNNLHSFKMQFKWTTLSTVYPLSKSSLDELHCLLITFFDKIFKRTRSNSEPSLEWKIFENSHWTGKVKKYKFVCTDRFLKWLTYSHLQKKIWSWKLFFKTLLIRLWVFCSIFHSRQPNVLHVQIRNSPEVSWRPVHANRAITKLHTVNHKDEYSHLRKSSIGFIAFYSGE